MPTFFPSIWNVLKEEVSKINIVKKATKNVTKKMRATNSEPDSNRPMRRVEDMLRHLKL